MSLDIFGKKLDESKLAIRKGHFMFSHKLKSMHADAVYDVFWFEVEHINFGNSELYIEDIPVIVFDSEIFTHEFIVELYSINDLAESREELYETECTVLVSLRSNGLVEEILHVFPKDTSIEDIHFSKKERVTYGQ